jgi:hypothetical protein
MLTVTVAPVSAVVSIAVTAAIAVERLVKAGVFVIAAVAAIAARAPQLVLNWVEHNVAHVAARMAQTHS